MEYAEIQKQFNEVISYSQGIEEPSTDELFEKWYIAKYKYIKKFGDSCIYEYPEEVTFQLSEEDKDIQFNSFINSLSDCTSIYSSYYYKNMDEIFDLIDFLKTIKSDFYSNILSYNYKYQNRTINKGTKIIRSFKYFISDKEKCRLFQDMASMVIQKEKIKGKFCISVHPLDYLSVSENNHNWRSCHALDGDYRAGNLSYMMDSSTVICYLKSDNDEFIPNFGNVKWNSKKWRMLLFLSDNSQMIFAGRQYPFTSNTSLQFIKDNILPNIFGDNAEDVVSNYWGTWIQKKISKFSDEEGEHFLLDRYIMVGNYLMPMREVVQNLPNSLMFNDILDSTCYDPLYITRKRYYGMTPKDTKFFIGGEVKCLRCGQTHISLSSTMMCNDCELEYGECEDDIFAYCPCCGRRYYYDDGVYIDSADEIICPDCADNYAHWDDEEEIMVYNDD